MADPFTVDRIINKILLAEQHFQVRTVKERKNLTTKQADLNKKKKEPFNIYTNDVMANGVCVVSNTHLY